MLQRPSRRGRAPTRRGARASKPRWPGRLRLLWDINSIKMLEPCPVLSVDHPRGYGSNGNIRSTPIKKSKTHISQGCAPRPAGRKVPCKKHAFGFPPLPCPAGKIVSPSPPPNSHILWVVDHIISCLPEIFTTRTPD